MTAMFPDSGVPATDAKNSILDPDTVNCNELWYSTTRCQPRFDPAAANAVLAELVNLINKGEVSYDCSKLDQLQLATNYMIQRGIPHFGAALGGTAQYLVALDPPLTRYNNGLTLVLIPVVTNTPGPVQINVDGRGFVPVLRNDGQQLIVNDFYANYPVEISYYNGAFYFVGLARSQVPLVVVGTLDVWIRTDGNDTTGDGSANSAAKAFRTINGAWARVSARYAASASLTIVMRLGIPGTYEYGSINSYGGNLMIVGDVNNPNGYHIDRQHLDPYPSHIGCLNFMGVASAMLQGLTFDCGAPAGQWFAAVIAIGSRVYFDTCRWNVTTDNTRASMVYCQQNSTMVYFNINTYEGNGHVIGEACIIFTASNIFGASAPAPASLYVNNLTFTNGFLNVSGSATYANGSQQIIYPSNTHGPKYNVANNSYISMGGQPQPGDTAGFVGAYSNFYP